MVSASSGLTPSPPRIDLPKLNVPWGVRATTWGVPGRGVPGRVLRLARAEVQEVTAGEGTSGTPIVWRLPSLFLASRRLEYIPLVTVIQTALSARRPDSFPFTFSRQFLVPETPHGSPTQPNRQIRWRAIQETLYAPCFPETASNCHKPNARKLRPSHRIRETPPRHLSLECASNSRLQTRRPTRLAPSNLPLAVSGSGARRLQGYAL